MQGRMPGNVMGTPHSNNNYPQNPENNARKGGSGKAERTGDKLQFTSEKGLPESKTMPPTQPMGMGPTPAHILQAGRMLGAPNVSRPTFRRPY